MPGALSGAGEEQISRGIRGCNPLLQSRLQFSGVSVKLTTVLLFLIAGLALGWFAHERWGSGPVEPAVSERSPASPLPEAGPLATYKGPDPDGQVDSVTQLLQQHAYPAAVERFESLQDLADAAGMQQARAAILLHAQAHIKAGEFTTAMQLLQRFLVAAYRDTEANLLLAEVYVGQQDYLAAIEQLYEARGYAYRPEMLTRITQRIRLVVNEQGELYRSNEDIGGLLALFQDLTQREPEYAAWFIELAIAQLAVNDRDAARRSLELVMHDPDVGKHAQAILMTLQQPGPVATDPDAVALAADVAEIPLTRSGQHFLVDVSPGDTGSLSLLIDTGASLTIVTPEALQRARVRYRDTGRSHVFNTANGRVRAPVYILESLSVGDWYVQQLEIGVLDLGGHAGIDGLLGMNYLKHFRFFIDQNESVLRLSLN